MIRNAVLHLTNEQPLIVDLFRAPRPEDVSLVCTNLRQPNGQRPIFVDRSESVFVFPYAQIRFLEVPPGAVGDGLAAAVEGDQKERRPAVADDLGPGGDDDVGLDPAFLERIRAF